jgi:hypothetical protein
VQVPRDGRWCLTGFNVHHVKRVVADNLRLVGGVNRDEQAREIGFLQVVALAEVGVNELYAAGEGDD